MKSAVTASRNQNTKISFKKYIIKLRSLSNLLSLRLIKNKSKIKDKEI
jgi:hypothetical protein